MTKLWYIGMMIGATVIIALNMPMYHGFGRAFRYSFFQVSSIMTTTGYSTADFVRWLAFADYTCIIDGSRRVCRLNKRRYESYKIYYTYENSHHSIKKAVSPRSVFSVKVDGKTVEKNIVNGVLGYFVVYMLFAAARFFLSALIIRTLQ